MKPMIGEIEKMIETILAYALLWKVNFIQKASYDEAVDRLFLQYENDPLLLDLEWNSYDCEENLQLIYQYMYDNQLSCQYNAFGKILFQLLENIYYSGINSIEEFGRKSFQLSRLFPEQIFQTEPFWTLSYADDCLAYDDEAQTRELYEKAFQFYQ